MTEGMEPDMVWRMFIYMISLQAGRKMAENMQEFVKNIKCHKEDEEELQEEGTSEDQIYTVTRAPISRHFWSRDADLTFANWLSMAIFSLYINFICQQLLRNHIFASKPLPRVRQHASVPIPLPSGLKDYILLTVTHRGYTCDLLDLSLLSSQVGWNTTLGVCKGCG